MINQQLISYIRYQLQQGSTKEKITADLLSNGWNSQDVEEGFNAITANPTSVTFKNHSGKKIFIIILILFLLAGGASAYYYKDTLLNSPFVKNLIVREKQVLNTLGIKQEENTPTPVVEEKNVKTPTSGSYKGKEIYIFTDDTTFNALSEKINQLSADITSDLGVKVIINHENYSSPIPIRNVLKQSFQNNTLLGSILIGNIPTFNRKDGFYTDWFYQDLSDNCPIDNNGVFASSTDCGVLSSFSKRNVFEGRITPPTTATNSNNTDLIGTYLDKDHAYRTGGITFPKKMLLYPSVNILQEKNGSPNFKNPISTNVTSSVASQSRYTLQDVDTIYEKDPKKQSQNYLTNLKNNRYETALIYVHGSTDGEFPTGNTDGSEITAYDIINTKPNIFYVNLLSCSNGAFKSPYYLAGEFLFNGDTLLVSAQSQEANIPNFLYDPPLVPMFFQPLSFLNSSAPLGELFKHDSSLYITQYFGDPTLRMINNISINPPQLQIESTSIDFGKTSSEVKAKTISIKNISQSDISILMPPDWGTTINNKPLYDYHSSVLKGKDFQGFILDKTKDSSYKTITIPAGQNTTFSFVFSPSVDTSGKIINGKYFDTFSFLTSDPKNPFIDINLTAEQEK